MPLMLASKSVSISEGLICVNVMLDSDSVMIEETA